MDLPSFRAGALLPKASAKEKLRRELDFIKIEVDHTRLGWFLVAIGWATVIGVFVALSHNYWTIDYFFEVLNDTITNIQNNYGRH